MNEMATQETPLATPESPAEATTLTVSESLTTQSFDQRRMEACRIAAQYAERNPDWVSFFREILGSRGVVARLFKKEGERDRFVVTDEYYEILLMLARLRKNVPAKENQEPTKVITVRIPNCLHSALTEEANARNTSVNQLCISKLMQYLEAPLVPYEPKPSGSGASHP